MTKGKISEAIKLAGTKYSYFSNPIISYYFYPTDSNNFQLRSGGYPLLVNSSNAFVRNDPDGSIDTVTGNLINVSTMGTSTLATNFNYASSFIPLQFQLSTSGLSDINCASYGDRCNNP